MERKRRFFKFLKQFHWIGPQQNFVLLAIRPQKLFRHSFIALYDVYDIRSGKQFFGTIVPGLTLIILVNFWYMTLWDDL